MGRTTIRLADELLRQAKKIAAESGRTLTSVIEDALRESFLRRDQPPKKKRITLPVWKGRLRAGVNTNSNAELLELMDEEKINRLYRDRIQKKNQKE